MALYRITLDVYNTRATYPGGRVSVIVEGWCPDDARRKLRTVYVTADRKRVSLIAGTVGRDGLSFPEWEVISTRAIKTAPQWWVWEQHEENARAAARTAGYDYQMLVFHAASGPGAEPPVPEEYADVAGVWRDAFERGRARRRNEYLRERSAPVVRIA